MTIATFLFAALVAVEPAIRLVDAENRDVPNEDVRLTLRRTERNGACQVDCSLVATGDAAYPRLCRLVATVPIAGDGLVAFDGADVKPVAEGVHRNPLMKKTNWHGGHAMFGAVWNDERGLALGTGADGADSFVELEIGRQGGASHLSVSVNAALLRKGATYTCTFNAIAFDPKYGERDALARYYALYPSRFTRAREVAPAVYGICAGYQSWINANPEACRFMDATWEWCIAASRHWGDVLCVDQVKPPHRKDYTYTKTLDYRKRDGSSVQLENDRLSSSAFLDIQRSRLAQGYYCGVANGWYMMALSNISNILAERYPDSLSASNPVYPNPYPFSSYVYAFPECTWGKELRRQLAELSAREDIGCIAFDVSAAGGIYRGERLKEMNNVGWDAYGPGVARGIANGKVFDFVHSLSCMKLPGKMGVAVNTCPGQVNDVLHADMILVEQPPWSSEPPYPQIFRYLMGEKAITFWEGYSPRDFDANFDKWSPADQEELIRQLSRHAVHQQFAWGVSLPAHFLTEYVSKVSRAFSLANEAGWKPVPGARVPDGFSLTRYGLGDRSILAINNLAAVEGVCRCRLYSGELKSGFAGSDSDGCQILFAPYFGGMAKNVVAKDEGEVSCVVGPLLVTVLEAVGSAVGTGSLDVAWSGDFTGLRLKLASTDFKGRVDVRANFEGYCAETTSAELAEGECCEIVFRNELLAGQEEVYRKFPFASDVRIRHAPNDDSRDIAERMALFFLRTTQRRPVLEAAADTPGLVVSLVAPNGARLELTAKDRMVLSRLSRRFLNAINAEKFPNYRPNVGLLPSERKYFSFQRH